MEHAYLPKQGEFLQSINEVSYAGYIGGVGSGKTHTLNFAGLIEATYGGSIGVIGAPSYRMLADVTRRKFFDLCPKEWIREWRIADNKVTLINNSEILFRSFDQPGPLQGLDLDWFGGDEMGLVGVDVFRMMQSRLRRPGGRHKGFIVGNPAGPTHWTYEYFVLKAREFPTTYRLTQATSYENKFIEDSYTKEMEISFGKDSLFYRRFVLGEFVAFEGAYWPNFDIRPVEDGGMVLPFTRDAIFSKLDHSKPWRYGKVLDFGFEHPWVLLWFVHDGKNIVFYDEYWQRHTGIQDHCRAIKAREAEHREILGVHAPAVAWTDHDAQDRYEIENCHEDGEFIGFSCSPAEKNNSVMPGILLVQSLINRRQLWITERCSHSRLEIPSYRAKPIDKSDKEAPIKEKDDTCDCIRMACWMELRGMMPIQRYEPSTYSITEDMDALEALGRHNPNNLIPSMPRATGSSYTF